MNMLTWKCMFVMDLSDLPHTQGWESETSFKLVYFEFVGLLML